jgi:hypothetical protein
MEAIVECFCLGKQKVVLFPTFRENGWVAAGNALTCTCSTLFTLFPMVTMPYKDINYFLSMHEFTKPTQLRIHFSKYFVCTKCRVHNSYNNLISISCKHKICTFDYQSRHAKTSVNSFYVSFTHLGHKGLLGKFSRTHKLCRL